jgi:hypothetical protein
MKGNAMNEETLMRNDVAMLIQMLRSARDGFLPLSEDDANEMRGMLEFVIENTSNR